MRYQEATNDLTGEVVSILRFNDDGSISSIPLDPANSDYQRYLNPEAEQSTPNLAGDEAKTK
jgi:hypothetical protein